MESTCAGAADGWRRHRLGAVGDRHHVIDLRQFRGPLEMRSPLAIPCSLVDDAVKLEYGGAAPCLSCLRGGAGSDVGQPPRSADLAGRS